MSSETLAFTLAAVALLGSPGPGIAALVAAGRGLNWPSALRFYGAMQVGLALAAAGSAVGLAGLLKASPFVQTVLTVAATAYLLWLAWQIATAPVAEDGEARDAGPAAFSNRAAFLLGLANPKAYLAFASLMGAFTVSQAGEIEDGALKWAICVAVMVVVDLAWLGLGVAFGRIPMSARAERGFNRLMGVTILAACLAALI